MLTRENRLTSSLVFSRTVREGRRAGTRTLVVHLVEGAASGPAPDRAPELGSGQGSPQPPSPPQSSLSPRVGFVVSKAVGGAVTRNRVKRRLRHLVRRRLGPLPASAVLVVRALPPAGKASSSTLGTDLDRALRRVLEGSPAGSRTGGGKP